MFDESLSDMPMHEEIRDCLRSMIRRGLDPLEVADAAQTVASALAMKIEGPVRTGAKLYAAGASLMAAASSSGTQCEH